MKTVLLGALPAAVEELLARRRDLGQDLFDEVWEGCYHTAPPPHWRHGIVDGVLLGVSAADVTAAIDWPV